jgi:hypothetical protein
MLNKQHEKKNRLAAPDPLRAKFHNDTALYFGCVHTDELHKRFRAAGLSIKEPVIRQYNFKAIYLNDPVGVSIVFSLANWITCFTF